MLTSNFKRVGKFWQEVFTDHGEAKWVPQPGDTRGGWGGWDFAITTFADGMVGGLEVDLIFHIKTDPIWSSVGPSDGICFGTGQAYEQAVAAAGSFDAFWSPIEAEINSRLNLECHVLDAGKPPVQISTKAGASVAPTTFQEFQSWLLANIVWSGSVAPPGPTPTPAGGFRIFGPRFFFDGFAAELGSVTGTDGNKTPLLKVNDGTGWSEWRRA